MHNKRHIGSEYELIAKDYLVEEGYNIITTNFSCYLGELDIIAMDNEYLVFVEVKYRKNTKYGNPAESVNYIKQRKIIKTAMFYIKSNYINDNIPIRFDVISILGDDILLIKDGFSL